MTKMKIDPATPGKAGRRIFSGGGLAKTYLLNVEHWTEVEPGDVSKLRSMAQGAKIRLLAQSPENEAVKKSEPKDGDGPRKEAS